VKLVVAGKRKKKKKNSEAMKNWQIPGIIF
jgi:hypothetical protein